MKKINFILKLAILSIFIGIQGQNNLLITVKDGQFFKGNKPYYYAGTNYWYGTILATDKYGDKTRLIKELDFLKSVGIDNLRIMVGAEGGNEKGTVTPALQPEQGKYDEDLLIGLDFLLNEMAKRNMYAVLYLGNNWEWSGGMAQYLNWNGYGTIPNPNLPQYNWDQFQKYTEQFHSCEPCKEAYANHVKFIISRTNSINHKKYTEDSTIMSWQVANEPRPFSYENAKKFDIWLNDITALIRSLDSKHLISSGAEGRAGSMWDIDLFEKTHSNKNIDYLTMHIWPKNWGWYNAKEQEKTYPSTIDSVKVYMNKHIALAKKMNKPIVLEEFGMPRENESLSPTSSVEYRNKMYTEVLKILIENKQNKGNFAGINFWGFAGFAKPKHELWEKGDDFTADPPQEPQGLNSVFVSDVSTLNLIKNTNTTLNLK